MDRCVDASSILLDLKQNKGELKKKKNLQNESKKNRRVFVHTDGKCEGMLAFSVLELLLYDAGRPKMRFLRFYPYTLANGLYILELKMITYAAHPDVTSVGPIPQTLDFPGPQPNYNFFFLRHGGT